MFKNYKLFQRSILAKIKGLLTCGTCLPLGFPLWKLWRVGLVPFPKWEMMIWWYMPFITCLMLETSEIKPYCTQKNRLCQIFVVPWLVSKIIFILSKYYYDCDCDCDCDCDFHCHCHCNCQCEVHCPTVPIHCLCFCDFFIQGVQKKTFVLQSDWLKNGHFFWYTL